MDRSEALDYGEDFTLVGNGDWRLPDARELQSIVDHSPDATIAPLPSIQSSRPPRSTTKPVKVTMAGTGPLHLTWMVGSLDLLRCTSRFVGYWEFHDES
jgi:hypothetical protein